MIKEKKKKSYICINVNIRKVHLFLPQAARNVVPIELRFKKAIKRKLKLSFQKKVRSM